MAYKNIEDRRAYNREYMRDRRNWLKSHHFCVQCKKQDAYTLVGRRMCFDCMQKSRERERKNKGYTRILAKDDLYYTPPEKKESRYPPRGERHLYGLCELCCKPLDGAKLRMTAKALVREEAWICKACYEKAIKSLKKASAMKRPAEPFAPSDLTTEKQKEAWRKYLERHNELVKEWEERVAGTV